MVISMNSGMILIFHLDLNLNLNFNLNPPKFTEWEEQLDKQLRERIQQKIDEDQFTAKKQISHQEKKFFRRYILELNDDRYCCRSCEKQFVGVDFVKKHIAFKHPDLIKSKVIERAEEKQFFLNYFNDENKITANDLENAIDWANKTKRQQIEKQQEQFFLQTAFLQNFPPFHPDREIQSYKDLDAPNQTDSENLYNSFQN
eukprot:Anaeramoba_ignava/a482185_110.p2 GENE.a482185_110~~a482185_110.p2  ORF type:complete len:201 (+),score=81.81 a482185_110:1398-2000(+)